MNKPRSGNIFVILHQLSARQLDQIVNQQWNSNIIIINMQQQVILYLNLTLEDIYKNKILLWKQNYQN